MIAPKRLLHRLALTPFMLTALAATVLAGPEGNYQVSGTNIGDGSPYTGTVEVVRNGKTYSVRWEIAGATFVGSGLEAYARYHGGAADLRGRCRGRLSGERGGAAGPRVRGLRFR